MNSDHLPPIPCPLCDGCDHDLRGDLLDLVENIGSNLKNAAEKLIDAIEADGPAGEMFTEAMRAFGNVRAQVGEIVATVPDIAQIKAANA